MSPDILTPLVPINIITIIIDVAIVIITITITVLLTIVPVPLTILSTTLIFLVLVLLLLLSVQPVCAAALIRQKELQPALIVRDSAAVSGVGLIWIYWTGS